MTATGCLGSSSGSEIGAGHRPGDSSTSGASALQIAAGDAQFAQVATALPIKIRVRVLSSTSVALANEVVTFSVVTGAGTIAQSSVTSDANGYAETTWTLGTTSGAQSARASVLAGSVAQIFSATAVSGAAVSLQFQTQPALSDAGAAVAGFPTVRAFDVYGNIATTYNQLLSVTIQTNPSSAVLGGTASVAAVSGSAGFLNLTIDRGAVGFRLGASDGTLSVNSALFDVRCPAIFDSIGLPVYAYSVRKLRSAYTGSAFRVRRSDGVGQDIGFDVANCGYDEAALLTFIGASSATISTWYDQIGSRDATQTTVADQPRIVSSGTIDKFDGRQTIRFFGAEFLPGTAPGIAGTAGFGMNIVYRVSIYGDGGAYDGNGLYFLDRTTATNELTSLKLIGGKISLQKRTDTASGLDVVSTSTNVSTTAFQRVSVERARAVQFRIYLNGTLEGTLADTDSDITPPTPIIGRQTSTPNSYDFGISEFIFWGNPQILADRVLLDANQAKYF